MSAISNSITDLRKASSFVRDGRGNYSNYQTDKFGNLTAYVDELQENKWLYERNEHGQLVRYVEPGFNITEFNNSATNVPTSVPVDFKETVYRYNDDQLLTSITYAASSDNPLIESWSWQSIDTADGDSRFWTPLKYTSPDTRITKYEFDVGSTSVNRVVENFQGPGQSRTTDFTGYTASPGENASNPGANIELIPGGLLKSSLLDGQTTTIEYYEAPFDLEEDRRIGLVQSEAISGEGVSPTTTYAYTYDYNDYRYPLSIESPGGVVTTFQYDKLGQLIAVTYPAQSNVQLNGGNILFDENGIPESVEESAGQTIEYHYDAAGNRVEVIEQRDNLANEPFVRTEYTYDEMNRLETVSLPIDDDSSNPPLLVKYDYDKNGNLVEEQPYDDILRKSVFEYDARNLLILEKRPQPVFSDGSISNLIPAEATREPFVHYQYDTNGNLLKVTDARFLDEGAGPQTVSDATGNAWFYDVHGRLVATLQGDQSNHVISRTGYDNAGRVNQTYSQYGSGDSSFALTGVIFDGLGRVHKQIAPADQNGVSRTTQYNYDFRDNVTQVIVEAGAITTTESRFYDALDRLIGIDHVDPIPGQVGLKSLFAYDDYGYLAVELVSQGSLSSSLTSTIISDVIGAARFESVNAGNHVRLTRYASDALGNVIAVVSPDRAGEDILTESNGQGLAPLDQSVVSLYQYDLSGNQIQQAIVYLDREGELSSEVGSSGMGTGMGLDPIPPVVKTLISNSEYDNQNRPVWQYGPANGDGYRDTIHTEYNADSTAMRTTQSIFTPPPFGQNGPWQPATAVTDYEYDSIGRLYRTQLPEVQNSVGQTERPISYVFTDANGNVVKTIDTEGLENTSTYDELNRRITATRPNDIATETRHFNYFADGRLASEYTLVSTDITPFDFQSYDFDAVGNLIAETDSLGNTISFVRNGLGYIESVNDKAGQKTDFEVDLIGRILSETLDDNEITLPSRTWQYDAFDNLEQYTNRNGQEISYEYDDVGNRIRETWIGGNYEATFDFNPLGQLLSASDEITSYGVNYPNSSYANNYRSDSLLGSNERFLNPSVVIDGAADAQSKFGKTFQSEYQYDSRGLIAATTLGVSNGTSFDNLFTNDYFFDNLGRVRLAEQTIDNDVKSIAVGYNGSRLDRFDRSQNSTTVGNTHYYYQPDGKLQSLDHQAALTGGGTQSDSINFIYDAQGRITYGSWEFQEEAFDYDSIGQTLDDIETYGRDFDHEDTEILETDNEGNVTSFKRFAKPTPYGVQLSLDTFNNARFEFNDVSSQNFQIRAGTYKFRFEYEGAFTASGDDDERQAQFKVDDAGFDTPIGQTFPINIEDDVWEFEVTFDQDYGGSEGTLYLFVDLFLTDTLNTTQTNHTFQIRALEEFQFEWDFHNRLSSIEKTTFEAFGNTFSEQVDQISYHYDVFGDLIGVRINELDNAAYDWKFFVSENGQNVAAYTFDFTPSNGESFAFTATSFNGLGGEQFAADSYLPVGENLQQQTFWLYHDHQGNLSHTRHHNTGELQRTPTTITGETVIVDADTVDNSINSVVRGFTDYYYDRYADVSLRDNRLFDSVSQRFLNEGQGQAITGIADLYVREGIAPVGNVPPLHSSTAGFFGASNESSSLVGNVHTGLSTLGLIPVVGIAFDVADSGLYLFEGDYGNAALSGAAAVPILGYGAYAARGAIKTATFATIKTAGTASRYAYKAGASAAGKTFNATADFATGFNRGFTVSARTTFSSGGLGALGDGIRGGARNLFRGDSALRSATNAKGIGKSFLDEAGNLVPANPAGIYKGRPVTVAEHVLGGFRRGAKSNSPFTSFTPNAATAARYGDDVIGVNLPALRQGIRAGDVTGVAVLNQQTVQRLIGQNPSLSNYWRNLSSRFAARDGEYLIRGVVPEQFIIRGSQ